MIKLKKSLVEHSLNHANFQIRALAETEHIKHLVMQSEIEQLDKLLTLLYLVKEWTLPLSSWNQIILGVFFKLRNPFRDILWEKINQISIVGLIRIQFIPDFFSLPATNSFNSSGNTKVVKYPSIKFLTVSFVPYLRNRMNQILVLITQLNQTTNIANNQENNLYISRSLAYRVEPVTVPNPFTVKRNFQWPFKNGSLGMLGKQGKPTSIVPEYTLLLL